MTSKLPEEFQKEIKEAFFMFDINNKGRVETNELGNAARSLGQNPSEAEVKLMIKEADKSGKGYIEEKDFVAVLTKYWKPVNSEDDIVDAFKVFDREGTGFLDAKQLKQVLMNLGEKLEDSQVEEILKEANLDADGQLNYRSLTQLLLANVKR